MTEGKLRGQKRARAPTRERSGPTGEAALQETDKYPENNGGARTTVANLSRRLKPRYDAEAVYAHLAAWPTVAPTGTDCVGGRGGGGGSESLQVLKSLPPPPPPPRSTALAANLFPAGELAWSSLLAPVGRRR